MFGRFKLVASIGSGPWLQFNSTKLYGTRASDRGVSAILFVSILGQPIALTNVNVSNRPVTQIIKSILILFQYAGNEALRNLSSKLSIAKGVAMVRRPTAVFEFHRISTNCPAKYGAIGARVQLE